MWQKDLLGEYMRYKSLASIKVRVILDKSEFSNVEIVRRIRENSTPV